MNKIGLGFRRIGAEQRQVAAFTVASDFDRTQSRMTLRLTEASAYRPDDLTVSQLVIDGISMREQVPALDLTSPELAETPNPGLVSGSNLNVSDLAQPLEIGISYLVSYEITGSGGSDDLRFAAEDSPFAPQSLPTNPGIHNILVRAENVSSSSLMHLDGSVTFGFVSCRKAQWNIDLPSFAEGPELAETTEPGRVAGSGSIVSRALGPLTPGARYVLAYSILRNDGTTGLFTNNSGPFAFQQLPYAPGVHSVDLVAADNDTNAFLNVNGDLTFGFVSLRLASEDGNVAVSWEVSDQALRRQGQLDLGGSRSIHVSPGGNDSSGTGGIASPFRTPTAALAAALPGDTVYLRAGSYDPFIVQTSGLPGKPITITTLPGEERQAVIQGDLQNHAVYGGTGARSGMAWRSGVRIEAQNHIHIRNLTIQDCSYEGIYILGREQGTSYGHHVISGNLIRRTGNPGIMVVGFPPWMGRKESEPMPRTRDVVIEYNDVSSTNMLSDFNQNLSNDATGRPGGGVNECITVSSSCGDIITRYNDVHDSRQYGIDYKAGVSGGAIHGNRVWNIERYGIYLDTGRNTIENIDIYNNHVWECAIGITLARESDTSDPDPVTLAQSLININVYNNLLRDMQKSGIYCQGHPGDGPNGEITNVSIRFNTVYNCNQLGYANSVRLDTWADDDWQANGIVRNFDFIGNIIFKSDGAAGYVNEFRGRNAFLIADNLVDVDPLFLDPDAQDFRVRSDSPARSVSAEFANGIFRFDAAGNSRSEPVAAGAFS